MFPHVDCGLVSLTNIFNLTALGANRGVGFPPLNRPVASGTRTGPRKPVNPFPLQKPYKPVSGPKFPIKMVRVQPRGSGSVASDQKGSGGNHHVFDKKDMEEVAPSRTRNLSPSGKEHAARVRAKGACEPCRKAKRKVTPIRIAAVNFCGS